MTNPELFQDSYKSIISTEEDLQKGLLRIEDPHENGSLINIPTVIKDIDLFNEIIFETWKNVSIKEDKN